MCIQKCKGLGLRVEPLPIKLCGVPPGEGKELWAGNIKRTFVTCGYLRTTLHVIPRLAPPPALASVAKENLYFSSRLNRKSI